jgi:hypothetical protein
MTIWIFYHTIWLPPISSKSRGPNSLHVSLGNVITLAYNLLIIIACVEMNYDLIVIMVTIIRKFYNFVTGK